MINLESSETDSKISNDDKELLYRVAKAMVARRIEEHNPSIPAGYTYLGQFIAHDLTFHDTRGTHFSSNYEPVSNIGGNAVLDLRNLYAGGPNASPLLYEFEGHGKPRYRLRLSNPRPTNDVPPTGRQDLQRLKKCPFLEPQGTDGHGATAVVGDPRNDENIIISQLTVLLSRVHNQIAQKIIESGKVQAPFQIFDLAKRLTVQCYRRIVVRDYLERLLDPEEQWRLLSMYESRDFEGFEFLDGEDVLSGFTAPKEFSFSAFRFGHAMVRDQYSVSEKFPDRSLTRLIEIVSNRGAEFPITEGWAVDWRRFFFNPNELAPGGATLANGVTPVTYSNKLMASAPTLLGHEAVFMWHGDDAKHGVGYRDLIRSKLERVQGLSGVFGLLPMVNQLTKILRSAKALTFLKAEDQLTDPELERLARNCPLYLYVLMEAEIGGGLRLGPIGSRIIGETT